MDRFDDVLAANQNFATKFTSEELTGTAVKGLAIVTCTVSYTHLTLPTKRIV